MILYHSIEIYNEIWRSVMFYNTFKNWLLVKSNMYNTARQKIYISVDIGFSTDLLICQNK